ncbi:Nucleolar protein 58 [Irineochytrium annulatum]|nr:Nucleolar protein 58 [Irineochytrium annulatum]
MVLVLFETPAGYALFKMADSKKLDDPDNIFKYFDNPDVANKTVKLKAFSKFENTTDALSAVTALVEGKLSKSLKSFLTKELDGLEANDKLLVGDSKLATSIAKKMNISVVADASSNEVMRGIRSQLAALISGLPESDMNAMVLGLSHSLSRYKLKFSPDKVDTMIIQAIHLLDDLDKELNTYAMRCKEWYGWHFPEMTKILVDNLAYAKVVKTMGFRTNASKTDLSTILPEELEKEVKDAAEISMGTEISEEDIENISFLCDQIISITEYRVQLYEYLKNRMGAIAPNLTCLLGELVGARLIAHAGSLVNLSKHAASTIQILGAEKALFRALKSKHDTPKYGLIYHASLVGQAGPKIKGKIARSVATKAALAIRVDAMGEAEGPTIGVDLRAKVEGRLRQLEGKGKTSAGASAVKGKAGQKKYELSATKTYNASADIITPEASGKKRKAKDEDDEDEDEDEDEEVKPSNGKAAKGKSKKVAEPEEDDDEEEEEKPKKKKKKVVEVEEESEPVKKTKKKKNEEAPKKKKKKTVEDDE